MPSSPTPGSPTSIFSRNFDADIGLRRMTTGSALPTLPQSVPRGRSISWLHWFASATACRVARPPVRIRLERPAFGDFYFQAFNGSVSLPVAGYNYNSDWTPLLAGLSPAGMAASFAARSFATEPRLPRNAPYDRSCLKADIRRAALRVIVKIEIAERLPIRVADDERLSIFRDRRSSKVVGSGGPGSDGVTAARSSVRARVRSDR
jgi:hypothetical protein